MKDIRKLIAKVKNLSYEKVAFDADSVFLNTEEQEQFQQLLARYRNDEPISKILNSRGFWKYDFFVNEDVLDPRPETELIIETVLTLFNTSEKLNFLDIGTGSGCILLSLLGEFENSAGTGIDISEKAIAVARKNQQKLNIKNANFENVSWNNFASSKQFDVIVSNPPYIRTSEIASLDKNVRKYDPLLALDGGETGLRPYQEISALATHWLKPNGYIIFEVGYNQAQAVSEILESNGYTSIQIAKDLAEIDRIVYARMNI
ncbi:MAG: peptide chain release factor N(5)-glutamine methyltransferase [Alphaproteobacteria bacterium]|nr:peptide chain release factor N(5)-glutamine methyltransferase [Alphaproteobacteria bacterium]